MNHHFESALVPRGIDVKNGFVRGATICTAGVEAKGHGGLRTDETLLRQLLQSAQRKGTIPVGLDHKSGVKGAAGAARNFRLTGNKLIADIQFFKSHADFPLVMEQLATLGGTMGISASFVGASEDNCARCSDLLSADLTLFPACCPTGLFSARGEDEDSEEPMTRDEKLEEILDQQEELLDRLDVLEERQEALLDALGALQDDDDEQDEDDDNDESLEPVLDERGAYGTNNHSASFLSFDLDRHVAELQRSGKSQREAHILALKEFARINYQSRNL